LISIRPELDVYSIALLTAMGLAVAALAVTLAHAVRGGRDLLAAAGRLCLVALAFAVFALSFHSLVGHSSGSAEGLSLLAFLNAHRAMVIVILLTAGLAAVALQAAARQSSRS